MWWRQACAALAMGSLQSGMQHLLIKGWLRVMFVKHLKLRVRTFSDLLVLHVVLDVGAGVRESWEVGGGCWEVEWDCRGVLALAAGWGLALEEGLVAVLVPP